LSQEYTLLCILEYLCFNSRNMPISKYHIITKVPGQFVESHYIVLIKYFHETQMQVRTEA